jgi:long-chain acyl-CoA synthetase
MTWRCHNADDAAPSETSPEVFIRVDAAGTELVTAEAARDVGARIASQLTNAIRGRDGFIVFQARNSASLLVGIYGALLGGLAPAVISDSLTEVESRELLADLPHSILVTDRVLDDMVRSDHSDALELSETFSCRPMHFTSGTSGRPKGVWSGRLTRTDSLALAAEERSAWGLVETDVHLVSGPFSHSAPLRFALHSLLNGGAVAVPRGFDARVASALIERGVVNTAFMAPVHLQRLVDSAPPPRTNMRLVAHAGASCPDRVRLAAIDRIGESSLVEFYSSTEGLFTICSAAEWRARPGTVGRARPGRELRVDDEGRVWCRVPAHARFEYWGDPDKTRSAWDGDWFTVGDLGRLDADGYLYLEGRRSDLIITGGVNVYPAELERVLSGLQGVSSVAVFAQDDPDWGQRVCAAYEGPASIEALRDYASTHLAPAKRPKRIFQLDALPTTRSGKIDRGALAALE